MLVIVSIAFFLTAVPAGDVLIVFSAWKLCLFTTTFVTSNAIEGGLFCVQQTGGHLR